MIADDIYKWTDEEGKIHYGKKPTTGSFIEEIKIKDKPDYDEELKQQNEEQKKILDVFEEERKERNEQIEEKKQIRRERKERCEDLRKELNLFEQRVVIIVPDEEGKPVAIDKEKWAAQFEELRKAVKKCR